MQRRIRRWLAGALVAASVGLGAFALPAWAEDQPAAGGPAAPAQDPAAKGAAAEAGQPVYGSQLMTPQERTQYR